MKKTKRILSLIAVFLLIGIIFTACSSSKNHSSYGDASKPNAVDPSYGWSDGKAEDMDYPLTEGAPETDTGIDSSVNTQDMQEKIIKTVYISAESKEYDRALDGILNAVRLLGGYEESVSTNGKTYYANTYNRNARLVLRIPAEKLSEFLSEIGGLINVVSQNAESTNVTQKYYDIESRIRVLESERSAYENMLRDAKDVTFLLEVEKRLYDVIEEIESYKTQLRYYDSKVSYSTVTISLSEVVEYRPVTTPKDTFGTRIWQAFSESWKAFADGVQDFAVWFVYAIPTLLVMAVLVTAAILIGVAAKKRRINRRMRPNANEQKESTTKE